MTANEVLDELRTLGKDNYRRIMANHGVPDPCFGVKVEDLKKIQKRVKIDHDLALALYDTGVYDARYLAGLIADDARMTRKDLRHWASTANCPPLCQFTVAWVAAGSRHGRELAREWIDSKKELLAVAGWFTLSARVGITADAELDLAELRQMITRVETTIHAQPDRVRYAMNAFLIAAGSGVAPLTDECVAAAGRIGTVTVDMGDTSCQVPDAAEYIAKVRSRGAIGRKRKSAKC